MEDISLSAAEPYITTAKSAFESGEYSSAASAYGNAAKICHDGLLRLYCAQANALLSADLFEDAAKVSESAIAISPKAARPRYLQGTALFRMGRRALAKKSFEKAAGLESVRTLKMTYADWASRCDDNMENEHDDVMETIDATGGSARTVPVAEARKAGAATAAEETGVDADEAEQAPQPVKDSTRMQWYQSGSYVSVDVYAKNVDKEKSSVSFERSRLKVCLVRPGMPDYVLDKELFEDVVAESCTWSASKFKVEIRMKKAATGSTWKALDKSAKVLSAAVQAGAESVRRKEMQKGRAKQWDSLADKELKDYSEDDSPMALFRTLYKDADEDTRRAMMKSYSESGGQVLSTNWDEVKKKKVVYEEKKQ